MGLQTYICRGRKLQSRSCSPKQWCRWCMALRRQWNDTEKRAVFHLPCHGHRKINSEYLFNYIASGIRHWHSFNQRIDRQWPLAMPTGRPSALSIPIPVGIDELRWCSSVIHCIRRISLVFTDVNADDVHPINELTGINPRTMPDFVSTGRDYACRWVICQCWNDHIHYYKLICF
jgi:hypothetical protein